MVPSKASYFKDNALSEHEQKMCRCRLHIIGKNTDQCNLGKEWTHSRGPGCVNPYPACNASVGPPGGQLECGSHLNFENIPANEVKGQALVWGVPLSNPANPQAVISDINQWKSSVGK